MGSLNGYSTEGISKGPVSLIVYPQLTSPEIMEGITTFDTIPVPTEAFEADVEPLYKATANAPDSGGQPDDVEGSGTSFNQHELWRIIKPCWEGLADASTDPIIVHVSFSPLGHALPTSSVTDGDNNPPLSHSESIARMAIARCGPYPTVYGQSAVSIEFPKFIAAPASAVGLQ